MTSLLISLRQKLITAVAVELSRSSIPLERMLATASVWWGGILLLPSGTFSSSIAYRAMAEVAPEWVWGVAMVCYGIVGFVASTRKRVAIRSFVAYLNAFVWGFIAVMFYLGVPSSTAVATYSVLSLASAYTAVAIAYQRGHAS